MCVSASARHRQCVRRLLTLHVCDFAPQGGVAASVLAPLHAAQIEVMWEVARVVRDMALTRPGDLRSHRSLAGFLAEVDILAAEAFVEVLIKSV